MSICGFRIRAVAGWRGHLDGAQRFLHEATVVALAVHTSLAGQIHLRGVAPPVVLPRPRTCTPAAPPGQRAPAMQAPPGRNAGPIILLGAVLAGIRSHRFRTRCIKAIACPAIAYRQNTTASQDQAPQALSLRSPLLFVAEHLQQHCGENDLHSLHCEGSWVLQ